MRYATLILTGLLLGLHTANAQVSVGEQAPDFTFTSLAGNEESLSDYEHKVVMLYFFGANCPYCQQTSPDIQTKLYRKYESDTNFAAIGLDIWNDPQAAVQSFKDNASITFPLLLNARSASTDKYYGSYTYDRLLVVNSNGTLVYKGNKQVNSSVIDTVDELIYSQLESVSTTNQTEEAKQPERVLLQQNYPNPFNPSTTISYQIKSAARVRLTIYNTLGVKVATLVNRHQSPGNYTVNWNIKSGAAYNLSSGVYIYRLQAGDIQRTRKMILMK